MKKIIFAISLLIITAQNASAQSVDALFRTYQDEADAEYVNVPSFLIWLGSLFADEEEEKELKKISSVKVLDLDDCSPKVKERFTKQAKRCNLKGFEELVRVKDEDGDNVKVLMKQKKTNITDLLILITGDDCCLIHLKGNFKQEELENVINGQVEQKRTHGS